VVSYDQSYNTGTLTVEYDPNCCYLFHNKVAFDKKHFSIRTGNTKMHCLWQKISDIDDHFTWGTFIIKIEPKKHIDLLYNKSP
jgi:hypothetical protein